MKIILNSRFLRNNNYGFWRMASPQKSCAIGLLQAIIKIKTALASIISSVYKLHI